jgi:hypothetical protein
LLEFSRGTLRLQFTAIDTIAKHLGHHFISAKEMDLKTMRLFLRARFCVDAANVCLRIRIGTSSHEAKLTEQISAINEANLGDRCGRTHPVKADSSNAISYRIHWLAIMRSKDAGSLEAR